MDSHAVVGPSQPQLATPTSFQKTKKQDGPWGPQEDDVLRRAIEQIHGPEALLKSRPDSHRQTTPGLKWSDISEICFRYGCRRDAKQCRERWVNHLDPNTAHGQQLTEAEGRELCRQVEIKGKKWAAIGRLMGKPENQLKNYYYQQDKKSKNHRKQQAAHRESVVEQRRSRQHHVPCLPDPRPFYNHSAHDSHSRRASTVSMLSNPGLMSDAGSPAETSPRSPHSFSLPSTHQLPLPLYAGSKSSSPRSQYSAPNYMERSQPIWSSPTQPAYNTWSGNAGEAPYSRYYTTQEIQSPPVDRRPWMFGNDGRSGSTSSQYVGHESGKREAGESDDEWTRGHERAYDYLHDDRYHSEAARQERIPEEEERRSRYDYLNRQESHAQPRPATSDNRMSVAHILNN